MEEEEEEFPIPTEDYSVYYSNVIVIDNIPMIPPPKEEKLRNVLQKVFKPFGKVVDIHLPYNKEGTMSLGYIFVEWSTPQEAKNAAEKLNNYPLDNFHVFKTNLYEDLENYEKTNVEFKQDQVAMNKEPAENLKDWLTETSGRDQYVIRYGREVARTEIGLGPPGEIPCIISTEPKSWTHVQWSPKGTYLVTFHQLEPNINVGIILWGGANWKKLRKFRHDGVDIVDFSPNEKYLVTFSPTSNEPAGENDQAIFIWDIKTGQKLRNFKKISVSSQWPEFHWSPDDNYFSRIHQGQIYIYQTPSMSLLPGKTGEEKGKPVKLEGNIKDHLWSPSDNIICAFIPSIDANIPARVCLLQIPSRLVIAQQSLINISECHILWQDKGDYLAVKVDRQAKSKKTVTAFEFFRMRVKDYPVEALTLEDKVLAFAWEPQGNRFAIIHSENESTNRNNVSFYTIDAKHITKTDTLDKRQVTRLLWASRGRFIVIYVIPAGIFEFYDAETKVTMARDRHHDLCTHAIWDPTGRYLVTYISGWRTKTPELGYKFWNLIGNEIIDIPKAEFYQFLWRPRPTSILGPAQKKELDEKLSIFEKKFKMADEEKEEERLREYKRERLKLKEQFYDHMNKKKKEYELDAKWREGNGIREIDNQVIEQVVETVVSVKEEIQ